MSVSPDAQGLEEARRRIWDLGDDPRIAELVKEVAERVVERAGIGAGEEVLDVAAGAGNAAISAALCGARVTAADLTPELFAAGRRRAAERALELKWEIADAENLPWADERYDHVLSSVGVQFAPRHEAVARELVRVCGPGGQVTLANWAADGYIGRLWTAMDSYLPPLPDYASPPPAWGRVDHVEQLFAAHPVDLSFDRERMHFEAASPEAFVDLFAACDRPLREARRSLAPGGRWDYLREDLIAISTQENLATSGGFRVASDYLLIGARKRA